MLNPLIEENIQPYDDSRQQNIDSVEPEDVTVFEISNQETESISIIKILELELFI